MTGEPLTMMNRMLVVAGCLWSVFASQTLWACSFCPPDVGPSLWNELDQARSGVLAKLIRSPNSQDARQGSRYCVTAVLKNGQDQVIEEGDEIDIPLNVQSPIGSVHLLLGDGDCSKWRDPRGVSASMRAFLVGASKLPAMDGKLSPKLRAQRLAFALPHLVSRDRQTADAAFGEFATASNAAVKRLKPILNRRELTTWIELHTASTRQRRLIFLLLGVCADKRDLGFLKAALDERLLGDDASELDAVITAYLKLAGASGLDEIDRRLLCDPDVSLKIRRATANALRFHVDHETVIERSRVLASCRLLLHDPNSADFVLRDLARWKDWKSLGDVIELRQQAGDKRWLKQPISGYLNSCPLPAARSALSAPRKPDPLSRD